MELFESILDTTDTVIANFVFQAWIAFNNSANDWLTGMLVIFVAILGYLILIGRVSVTLPELFPRFFKMAFIYVLVTNFGNLVGLVFNLFTNVPESIATSLLLAADGNPFNNADTINESLDNVLQRGMTVTGRLFQAGGLTNILPYIFGVLVGAVTILVVGYVAFLLVLAKLAVAILLSVAPFFIVLYLFEGTRPIFEGWLRQTISYALIPIITYALMLLILNIVELAIQPLFAASGAELESLVQIAPFVVVMAVSFLLATQVLGIASGIGGGFQLSSLGAFSRAISTATAPARAFASGAAGAAINRSGLGARFDRLRGIPQRHMQTYGGPNPKQDPSAFAASQRRSPAASSPTTPPATTPPRGDNT